jgi:hypothetical protein
MAEECGAAVCQGARVVGTFLTDRLDGDRVTLGDVVPPWGPEQSGSSR